VPLAERLLTAFDAIPLTVGRLAMRAVALFLAAGRRSIGVMWTARAELLVVLATIGGWASLTAGIAEFLPARARAIWFLSAGVFLLSLAGWQFLGVISARGLYSLTRSGDA
jgi:hypothetical protein